MKKIILERAAQEFVEATANPPFLFDLGPEKGRKSVDEVQNGPIRKQPVDMENVTIPGGPLGDISLTILRPQNTSDSLPVILYTHGAGWVFGNEHTHDRLIRELAVGSQSAVVLQTIAYHRKQDTRLRLRKYSQLYNGLLNMAVKRD